jgi:hypothetical protein
MVDIQGVGSFSANDFDAILRAEQQIYDTKVQQIENAQDRAMRAMIEARAQQAANVRHLQGIRARAAEQGLKVTDTRNIAQKLLGVSPQLRFDPTAERLDAQEHERNIQTGELGLLRLQTEAAKQKLALGRDRMERDRKKEAEEETRGPLSLEESVELVDLIAANKWEEVLRLTAGRDLTTEQGQMSRLALGKVSLTETEREAEEVGQRGLKIQTEEAKKTNTRVAIEDMAKVGTEEGKVLLTQRTSTVGSQEVPLVGGIEDLRRHLEDPDVIESLIKKDFDPNNKEHRARIFREVFQDSFERAKAFGGELGFLATAEDYNDLKEALIAYSDETGAEIPPELIESIDNHRERSLRIQKQRPLQIPFGLRP